jgi:hypothetical protein
MPTETQGCAKKRSALGYYDSAFQADGGQTQGSGPDRTCTVGGLCLARRTNSNVRPSRGRPDSVFTYLIGSQRSFSVGTQIIVGAAGGARRRSPNWFFMLTSFTAGAAPPCVA